MTTPTLPTRQHSADVAEFLNKLEAKQSTRPTGGRGRLIFALDATASRQPTWDRACMIQGAMFEATAGIGCLDLQLVYYGGYDTCRASRWLTTAADLHRVMRSVSCVGGETQIERVLTHAIRETGKRKVNALIFVGDTRRQLEPAGRLFGDHRRLHELLDDDVCRAARPHQRHRGEISRPHQMRECSQNVRWDARLSARPPAA